jgi:hypothetical protein
LEELFGFVEDGFAFGRLGEIEVEEAVSLAGFEDFAAFREVAVEEFERGDAGYRGCGQVIRKWRETVE